MVAAPCDNLSRERSLTTNPSPSRGAGRPGTRPLLILVYAVTCLLVFAAHFRPWEVGYLEEWPLAADWRSGGGGAFAADYLEWTLSRPLHLLPSLLGLVIGSGSPIGMFAVLALVATAQFVAVLWALRPVSRSVWINGAVGLFLALHPLWPGGFLQRFLPAQTAALALAITLGCLIRWLVAGRRRWIFGACTVMLAGFLVYPGPAAVAPMMALAIALALGAPWRRGAAAVGAMTATSALMTLYSLVITRLISPRGTSYELANIEVAGVSGVRELASLVISTLLASGEVLVLAIVGVACLGAALALSGVIPHRSGWVMAATALASLLTTVVYFGHVGWLVDIDRVGYVISLSLFVALSCWPASRAGSVISLETVAAAILVTATLAGAVQGILHWQPAIGLQHRLLTELGPVVRDTHDNGEIVTVVDHSGTLGQMATFPLQYLGSASVVWNDDDTAVQLCFPDPAHVPSGGTLCAPSDTRDHARLVKTINLPSGHVDIYVGRKESDD